jgi:hypothetical protein
MIMMEIRLNSNINEDIWFQLRIEHDKMTVQEKIFCLDNWTTKTIKRK